MVISWFQIHKKKQVSILAKSLKNKHKDEPFHKYFSRILLTFRDHKAVNIL